MKIVQWSLFLLLIVISPVGLAKFSIAAKPDWVIDHSPSKEPQNTQGYGTSYLLFDQQIEITEDNQSDYTRVISRVNNTSGLSDLGKISIPFDPSYQSLQVHHVSIIRGKQHIDALDQTEFELIRQESELNQGIYNGKETALLLLSDLQINDTIDYAYTLVGKNPIFNNHVFEVFGLEWGIPVADLHIIISLPKDKKIKYQTSKKIAKPKIQKLNDHLSYSWHLENIDAIDYQGTYPKWYEARNYLEITEFSDWHQVSQWASDVFNIDMDLNADIISLINQWQLNQHDDLYNASKALQYVQNEIRYLGIEIGVNSHKPRSPVETFATKYGDCKDKTTLLHAMLKAMGIASKPFLVSTELDRSITERLPSPGLFNHVILQININGTLYWVDPTSIHQGSSLSNLGLPDYAYGLIIDKQTKELTPINRKPSQLVQTNTLETLEINNASKQTALAIETNHYGDFAEYWRSRLANNTEQQIQNQFESYTNQLYGMTSNTQDLQIDDNITANKLTFHEAYQLENPWHENNQFEYIETFAHSLLSHVEMPSRINRDSPLALAYPAVLNHQININDPDGKTMVKEQSIDISTNQISYQKTVQKNDSKITIKHQLKILKDHVSVKDLESYYDAIKSIKAHLSVNIGQPIEQKVRLKDSNDRLKSALQDMLKEIKQ